MTEAYAIKGPDGKIILWAIGESELDAWSDFCVVCDYQSKIPQELQQQGYTCVPVTVSEKIEADALLKELTRKRFQGGITAQDWDAIDAYLSRGQG